MSDELVETMVRWMEAHEVRPVNMAFYRQHAARELVMGDCRDCRFWEPTTFGHSWEAPEGWGACSRFDSGYVGVKSDYDKAYIDALDPHTGQQFLTAPDFGCRGFLSRTHETPDQG